MVQQIIPSHLGLSLSARKIHNGFVSDWMGLLRVTFTPTVPPTMFGTEHCPAAMHMQFSFTHPNALCSSGNTKYNATKYTTIRHIL